MVTLKAKHVFLALAILGTVLPLSQFIPFLVEHGPDAQLFYQQLWATRISSFFGWDVLVSALVLWGLVHYEGRRHRMNHAWVYLLCTLLVGVSLGLPLFLYAREVKLDRQSIPA